MTTLDNHQLDEDGFHEPDECEICLERNHSCVSSCRCGECCERLLIEASMRDGEREPLIQEKASPIYDDMSGVREQIGWLLNGPGATCVFFRRDAGGQGVCTIHDTRPLVCRLYDCDTERQTEGFADWA